MPADPQAAEVKAAGGVVWRRSADGAVEVAVIHRPRYDDWSLPKGKLDPGESWEQAAVREVEEELGARCRAGEELRPIGYHDDRGRWKIVRYWLMEAAAGGSFAPNDEVDEVRWLPGSDALALLSYERDREVLAEGLEALA